MVMQAYILLHQIIQHIKKLLYVPMTISMVISVATSMAAPMAAPMAVPNII